MLLRSLRVPKSEFEAGTGWQLKPEGACKGEVCIPLPASARRADGRVNVAAVADALAMPLVEAAAHKLWALGPVAGGRALSSAGVPEITLPDRDGNPFRLGSLKGTKVFLFAWASW